MPFFSDLESNYYLQKAIFDLAESSAATQSIIFQRISTGLRQKALDQFFSVVILCAVGTVLPSISCLCVWCVLYSFWYTRKRV